MHKLSQIFYKAFTLGEVLIVFFIIGIVASIIVSNGNSRVNEMANSSFTYNAFNAMNIAITEYSLVHPDLYFDNETNVCRAISTYVNTVPIINDGTQVANCSNLSIASPNQNTIPSLILASGARVYLAGHTDGVGSVIKVDIDGNKRRKTTVQDGDLVEFNVTKAGILLPTLGTLSATAPYLSASYGYFDLNTGNYVTVESNVSYREALCKSASYNNAEYCGAIAVPQICQTNVCDVTLNRPMFLK